MGADQTRAAAPAMRVAALFDIHANLPALDAVLVDVRAADVDLIVFGGDIVPGPMMRETLARLLSLDVLRGSPPKTSFCLSLTGLQKSSRQLPS